jgi:hypothetical protein
VAPRPFLSKNASSFKTFENRQRSVETTQKTDTKMKKNERIKGLKELGNGSLALKQSLKPNLL